MFPPMTKLAHLPQRGVIAITGADRVAFLNGLVSNEVANATPGQAVWAAILTPQGKIPLRFFHLRHGGGAAAGYSGGGCFAPAAETPPV